MPPRRTVCIDIGAGDDLADRISVDGDLARTKRHTETLALLLKNNDARLARFRIPHLPRDGRIVGTYPVTYTARQKCRARQHHRTSQHHAPTIPRRSKVNTHSFWL